MTEYPFMCPTCGCPLQLLAAGYDGKTKGTIQDAMEAHNKVVHPNQTSEDA